MNCSYSSINLSEKSENSSPLRREGLECGHVWVPLARIIDADKPTIDRAHDLIKAARSQYC